MTQKSLDFNLETCLEATTEHFAAKAAVKDIELVTLVHPSVPIALQGDAAAIQRTLTAAMEWAIERFAVQTVFVLAVPLSAANPANIVFSLFAIETHITLAELLRAGCTLRSAVNTAVVQPNCVIPSAVQQAIEQMGDSSGLTAQAHRYTQLWFTVSLQVALQSAEHPQRAAAMPCSQGLKLLLIDRPTLTRQVLSYQAARWGIEVSKAASIDAALLQHQGDDCLSLIIVDANSVDANSVDANSSAIDRLKQAQKLACAPLVLMINPFSADHSSQLLNGHLSLGAASVLPKPVHPSKLLKLFSELSTLSKQPDATLAVVHSVAPAGNDADGQAAVPPQDQPCSEQTGSRLAHLKVLLVEDNLINQKVTLRQLSHLGCTVDVAMHGLEAVAAVAQMPYDIVLMDCQMPLLDGYSATEQIRAIEQQTHLHRRPAVIIAITANTLKEDRERAIAVGMNDYLSKPVSQTMLTRTIEYWSQQMPAVHALPDPSIAAIDKLRQQINWKHLHRLTDDSAEFEWELLQIFVADSQSCLTQLKQAVVVQDYKQIELNAHHLNGSSGNIGAMTMQVAAEQLEYQARQRQLENSDRLLADLETSLEQIQTLIQLKDAAPNQDSTQT
jgi:hypothetical protein